jgi:hypothetical protein
MDTTVDIFNGVIHDLVRVVASESFVREQEVGIQRGPCFDVLTDLSLKDELATAGNNNSADLSSALKGCPSQQLCLPGFRDGE